MTRTALGLLVVLFLFAVQAVAHSGRTDSKGGHFNRKTGEYHYHGGGSSASVAPAPAATPQPRASYRTEARSSVRTGARTAPRIAAASNEVQLEASPATHLMRLAGGGSKAIAGYEDRGASYSVTLPGGGKIGYPKALVESIEPIPSSAHTARPTSEVGGDGLPSEGVVAGVIDGDTIRLASGEAVRLIGVDTPETVHPNKPVQAFGKEASSRGTF